MEGKNASQKKKRLHVRAWNDEGKNDQDSDPGPYNLRLIEYQNDRGYIGKLQLSEI
jgi:hypothetical protein